jgi:hypothetical protein
MEAAKAWIGVVEPKEKLIVFTTSENPINRFTNTNPRLSHWNTWQYIFNFLSIILTCRLCELQRYKWNSPTYCSVLMTTWQHMFEKYAPCGLENPVVLALSLCFFFSPWDVPGWWMRTTPEISLYIQFPQTNLQCVTKRVVNNGSFI